MSEIFPLRKRPEEDRPPFVSLLYVEREPSGSGSIAGYHIGFHRSGLVAFIADVLKGIKEGLKG